MIILLKVIIKKTRLPKDVVPMDETSMTFAVNHAQNNQGSRTAGDSDSEALFLVHGSPKIRCLI